MLALAQVEEIERLLAEGQLSHRKIAQITGISRATIGAIARGERPQYPQQQKRQSDWDLPLGPLARCRGCGGKVYLPCLLCRVRRFKAAEQAARRANLQHQRQLALRQITTTRPAETLARVPPMRLLSRRVG